jgi:hypothetical protein
MSSDSSEEKPGPHRMVKWSPPYRRENVEQPEFDLDRSHRDGLKAALKWREEKFGNQYRSADEAESDGTSGEESD